MTSSALDQLVFPERLIKRKQEKELTLQSCSVLTGLIEFAFPGFPFNSSLCVVFMFVIISQLLFFELCTGCSHYYSFYVITAFPELQLFNMKSTVMGND